MPPSIESAACCISLPRMETIFTPSARAVSYTHLCVDIVRCDDLGTRVDHRFDGFALECVQRGLDGLVAHFIALLGNIDSQLADVYKRQALAQKADAVVRVIAGVPQFIKGEKP